MPLGAAYESEVRALIKEAYTLPGQFVLHCTGAATKSFYWLQSTPGASSSLLHASLPYSRNALRDMIFSRHVGTYVSRHVTTRMAGRALARAEAMARSPKTPPVPFHESLGPLFGVACSAFLTGAETPTAEQAQRGSEAWIAVWSVTKIVIWHVWLAPGKRSRTMEEDIVSRAVVNAVAFAKGIPKDRLLDVGIPSAGTDLFDGISSETIMLDVLLRKTLLKPVHTHPFLVIQANGVALGGTEWANFIQCSDPEAPVGRSQLTAPVIFTGSFNPLHDGHRALLMTVEKLTGKIPMVEISLTNADKAAVDSSEALRRAAQFAGRWPTTISRAKLFIDKARAYGYGTVFVVGFDTAARVLNKKYYDDNEETARAILGEIAARNCSFLVAGRVKNGVFCSFESCGKDLPMPEFHYLFKDIPEKEFRMDISSTQIRKAFLNA